MLNALYCIPLLDFSVSHFIIICIEVNFVSLFLGTRIPFSTYLVSFKIKLEVNFTQVYVTIDNDLIT